jgi:hypothetical protein
MLPPAVLHCRQSSCHHSVDGDLIPIFLSEGVLKFTRKPEEGKSQERALFSEKEADAADMRATIQFEAPAHVRWSRSASQ